MRIARANSPSHFSNPHSNSPSALLRMTVMFCDGVVAGLPSVKRLLAQKAGDIVIGLW